MSGRAGVELFPPALLFEKIYIMINNQIVYGAPKLGAGQRWKVKGYLLGSNVRKCPKKFSDFNQLQYISKSGDFYHFIGDLNKVIVCTISIDKPFFN